MNAGPLGAIAVFLVLFCASTVAQRVAPAEAAIRAAFAGWMADFNARRADRVCNLFAPELRYDYRGFPERDYQEICNVLHRSSADPARRYRYALEIKEILVSGDLAVARVVWTLTVTPRDASEPTSSKEYSMDVFHRLPDGSWKIIRFTAYEAP
jgi:ketosteroid isomerase-like protein